ncbi:MSHA biogenesis protein MshK [Vibrio agarivorans]|uniref:MSHA biogenesis protein MshK n=1 Tax=Vibrio agarivorans TaxID=153622 RepID=UPI002230743E|nr:MSHA biogenesis protein MshK [Vibrio agarivorans]
MVKQLLLIALSVVSASSFAAQDPTAPLGWIAPKKTTTPAKRSYRVPKLNSIICQPEKANCSAILNSRVVSAGDTVNGYRVNQITDQDVTLSRAGKQWKLQMFTLEIKE